MQYLQRALSSSFSAVYCFKYLSDLLLIVNYDKITEKKFLQELSDALKKRKMCCGSSYRFKDLQQLPVYYKQAQLALQYGSTKPGAVNRCEDFTLEYVRHQINDQLEIPFSVPAMEKLKQYDATAGTEYYRTLAVYLLQERDQTKTAEILCIHRNTLIYRLKKIESLINIDLDDSRNRFALLLSFFVSEPDFLR